MQGTNTNTNQMKEQIPKLGTKALLLNGGQRLIRITCEGTNRKTFPILTFVQNSVKEQIIYGEKGNYKAATFNKRHKTITLQFRLKKTNFKPESVCTH